jgi:TetR/AcrR family transcriptional regulator, transcriptional repressor for nem operon
MITIILYDNKHTKLLAAMPLSKSHKEKSRQSILSAAGELFRESGFDGVGIDDIMKKAGLTRGAFYAHFQSKADLFAQVLATQPAFNRMLLERQGTTRDDALNGALDVIATYMDPGNIPYVTATCPMVSLARDVDKAGPAGRVALSKVVSELAGLLKNGMRSGDDGRLTARALTIIALCIGGVTVARTANKPEFAAQVLNACESEVQRLLTAA